MSTKSHGCVKCKRKSPLNMMCKCQKIVCISCRYPELHDCSFDFQKEGQEKLMKENPLIQCEKLEKI